MGCLLITSWAVVGIVAKFATIETTIRLNWGSCVVVSGRFVWDTSLTILLLTTRPLTGLSAACLLVWVLVASLTLLSTALHLIVVVPTLISRAKLRTLRVVLSGVSTKQSLEFLLMIRQFPSLVF